MSLLVTILKLPLRSHHVQELRPLPLFANNGLLSRAKYLLARAAIYRHFKNLLNQLLPSSIQLHTFESVTDPLFRRYLSATGVYFVMCHDGASINDEPPLHTIGEDGKETKLEVDDTEPQKKKVMFRSMILALLTDGYNVALINGLDWQDTKVCYASFASEEI